MAMLTQGVATSRVFWLGTGLGGTWTLQDFQELEQPSDLPIVGHGDQFGQRLLLLWR